MDLECTGRMHRATEVFSHELKATEFNTEQVMQKRVSSESGDQKEKKREVVEDNF